MENLSFDIITHLDGKITKMGHRHHKIQLYQASTYGYVASYIFGGDPSLPQFVMGLMIEGLAASAIVSFALMQWWKDKVEKINQVDDKDHTNQNT